MGAAALLGTAAVAATETAPAVAATSGLFGAAGAFSAGQTLMTVGTGVSTLAGIGGTVAQYQAAQSTAEYQEYQNELAAEAEEDANQQQLASMRAQYGASGVKLEGTPLTVLEDSAAEGAANVLAVRYGGKAASRTTKSNASSLTVSGLSSAGSSLMTGLSNVYGR